MWRNRVTQVGATAWLTAGFVCAVGATVGVIAGLL